MRISAQFQPSRTRRQPATRVPTVCVVDPNADDYQSWESLAQSKGTKLQIVASADEALQVARTATVDLWVVNTELPRFSGFELCSMLKSRDPSTQVFLLTEEYSPDDERQAWAARATLFGNKPLHEDWLAAWIDLQSRRNEPR